MFIKSKREIIRLTNKLFVGIFIICGNMAGFVNDTKINLLLENIIKEAEQQLVLFCPYFKLHDRLRDCLRLRIHDDSLRIIVVFGKNEEDPSKSLNRDDYEFLKTFPYVEVAYEKRLHAKYYANEKQGVITSLNLHTYSHNNNIEVGVQFETKNALKKFANKTLGDLASIISDTEDLATEAHDFFIDIYKNAEKIYSKEPRYSKSLFGLTKTYQSSEVLFDRTEWFYNNFSKVETHRHTIGFTRKSQESKSVVDQGFCIRTRELIAYDPAKPLSWDAYQTWSVYANASFTEKYCHRCGKNYKTTMRSPLCYDCKK